MRRRTFRPVDGALILLVTALVRWVSGAQRFTFLHTPDSEFYFSLGVFGSAVTDRAPDDYYYWTKLGVVLPLRAFASFLPPLVAQDVVRVLLSLIVAGSAYVVARRAWSRPGACVAAGFASLNTVVLAFIADPYASGAAVAALAALIATAVHDFGGDRPFRRRPAALMGLHGAWLVMINPYALIVGAAGCAGVLLGNAGVVRQAGRRVLARSAASVLAGFAAGFVAFLALGHWAFPGLNWFTSLYSFVGSADLSSWAESDWRWATSDTTLLVPVSVAVVSVIAVLLTPTNRSIRMAAGLSVTTLTLTFAYKLVSDSNVLEVGVYNSMLWPAALLALILVASATAEPRYGWIAGVLAAAAPVAWIIAGHWSSELIPAVALAVTAGAVLATAGLLRWARGGRVLVPGRPVLSAGVVLLAVLGCLFQVLQNGVPLYPTSTLSRVSYKWAFLPGSAGAYLDQDVQVQRWLLDRTAPHEQLLVWNERLTRSAASMQLWGSNSAGPGMGEPVGEEGLATIRELGVDAVVTYAADPTAVDRVRAELEAGWKVADPECRTFTSDAAVPSLQVCILRLGPERDPG